MRFGKIDFDYAADLAGRDPAADGPIYMVNFMKYKTVAEYRRGGDGAGEAISGIEADDKYAPVDVLKKIGAHVAFHGKVVVQGAEGEWDRMGIVKYPTRRSFIEMQDRPDFKEKRVHKDAGMDYTVIVGALPAAPHSTLASGRYALFDLSASSRDVSPSASTASFVIEGTIIHDDRRWSSLTVSWHDEVPSVPALARGGDRMVVVAQAEIDRWSDLLTSP